MNLTELVRQCLAKGTVLELVSTSTDGNAKVRTARRAYVEAVPHNSTAPRSVLAEFNVVRTPKGVFYALRSVEHFLSLSELLWEIGYLGYWNVMPPDALPWPAAVADGKGLFQHFARSVIDDANGQRYRVHTRAPLWDIPWEDKPSFAECKVPYILNPDPLPWKSTDGHLAALLEECQVDVSVQMVPPQDRRCSGDSKAIAIRVVNRAARGAEYEVTICPVNVEIAKRIAAGVARSQCLPWTPVRPIPREAWSASLTVPMKIAMFLIEHGKPTDPQPEARQVDALLRRKLAERTVDGKVVLSCRGKRVLEVIRCYQLPGAVQITSPRELEMALTTTMEIRRRRRRERKGQEQKEAVAG